MEGLKMSNTTLASQRIASLLDENSFVEIGALVTARATDFNLKQTETPSDGVITGYGVIDGNLHITETTISQIHCRAFRNVWCNKYIAFVIFVL